MKVLLLLPSAAALLLLLLLHKGSTVDGAETVHLLDNVTVSEGESVTLRCRIEGEVTRRAWLKGSKVLFAGTDKWTVDRRMSMANNNDRDYSIQINKVQPLDEGDYICTYQVNNRPVVYHLYLIVQVPARIVNISKSVTVNEGENVNLFCLAVGRPEPSITWKEQEHGLLSEGEFLNITEIKGDQSRDYECVANNGVGRPDQQKVQVTVNTADA